MRRARRKAGRDLAGAALIGVALLALALFGAAGFMLRPPPTDPDTLCRTDAPLAAHTFILVDATDRLEPRHRRVLQTVVRQEAQRLAAYDRLTLAAIRADRPQEPRRLFSLCNPGDGRAANPLYQNTRQAQARWEEEFGAALERATRRASSSRGAARSPIAAALRAAAADPDFGADIAARRLVLISDLLEHDPQGFSLYVEDAEFDTWRSAAAPPDLTDVSVRIVTLDRPDDGPAQTRAHDSFWPAYLAESGASPVRFDPRP